MTIVAWRILKQHPQTLNKEIMTIFRSSFFLILAQKHRLWVTLDPITETVQSTRPKEDLFDQIHTGDN